MSTGAEGREGTEAGAHMCCLGTQIPPSVESSARKTAGAPCNGCTWTTVDNS